MTKYNDYEPRSIQDERKRLQTRIDTLQNTTRPEIANGEHPERVAEVDELIARCRQRLEVIREDD